jgi:hypothetical protein
LVAELTSSERSEGEIERWIFVNNDILVTSFMWSTNYSAKITTHGPKCPLTDPRFQAYSHSSEAFWFFWFTRI